jgi:hypothetical protein
VATLVGNIGVGGAEPEEEYERPADWLPLPSVASTDHKFVGLYAVFDHPGNYLALQFSGNYTVDWGDGSALENRNAGQTAVHLYSYSASALDGTETTRGYKQAIVTVTMQAGQTFTSANIFVKHTASGLPNNYGTGWLDIRMAGSAVTTLTISGSSASFVKHRMLEQFEYVGTSAITTALSMFHTCPSLRRIIGTEWTAAVTSFSRMFETCYSLTIVSLLNTSSGTNFSQMFQSCHSLQTVPLLNTAAGTNFQQMFQFCYSLQTIPLLNTAAGTNFSLMFYACYDLKTIPLLNTSSGTNFSQMFYGCYSLQTIPLLNTASGTNFLQMFYSCFVLKTVPLLNTSSGTNFQAMFHYCIALKTVPLLNTAAGTNFSSMFEGCHSLQSIPLLNTSSGTLFNSMFQNCHALTTIPLLNTASGTNFSSMFGDCGALQVIPLLNVAAGTTFGSNIFINCSSLSVGAMSGTSKTISYASCRLSAAELNNIYTNLASGVTAQTITVSSNYGTTGDDPSIATAKGWTVTG